MRFSTQVSDTGRYRVRMECIPVNECFFLRAPRREYSPSPWDFLRVPRGREQWERNGESGEREVGIGTELLKTCIALILLLVHFILECVLL